MRRCELTLLVALLAVGPAGCLGRGGPDLPANVGASHAEQMSGGSEASGEPAPPAEPVPVGTLVWADYRDTGFHFHGVVVERREEEHRVIYDDGASEWVGAAALLPEGLVEDAEIDVRRGYTDAFNAATLGRRVGNAVYVRLAGGDELWTTLPHVRFAAGRRGVPSRGDAAPETERPVEGQVGSSVLVNYQGQGLRFAAVVTARGDDGRVHVVYLDGETEWVEPRFVGPDDLNEGSVVHIRRTWDPPDWVRGRVRRRVGDAMNVELDDGGVAWTTLFRVRSPVAQDATPPPPAATPADASHEGSLPAGDDP